MSKVSKSAADFAGVAMWSLAQHYAGRVGYAQGVKSWGLASTPPVIDCSGWVAMLLKAGMQNADLWLRKSNFRPGYTEELQTYSENIINVIELQTRSAALIGSEITESSLPRFATIGLCQGGGAWAQNHPRPRGITHVVQVLRRPTDSAAFVSESQGWAEPNGLRLTPLATWLETVAEQIENGQAWAVDPFKG